MKKSLQIEELGMLLLGVYFFSELDFNWWWFLILILTPDIGMLGYFINSKVGAISYNLLHHKGLAIIIFFIGIYFNNKILQLIGVILFSHASLDRVFGYGLKYFDNFKHTHLGNIGK